MLLGIQILGLLFGLFMIYITFLNKKRDEFTTKESIFWTIVWGMFILVAVFPWSIDFLIKDVLNMSRTLDFFIIAGFMFLIAITFYNYTLLRKNQRKVETVVRNVAIKNADEEEDK